MYFRDFHVSTRGYRHINISAFVEIFFPGEFRTHLSILCNPLKSLLKNYYSCYRRFSQQSIITPAIWVLLFLTPELKNNPAKNREQGWRDHGSSETNASRFYRYRAGRPPRDREPNANARPWSACSWYTQKVETVPLLFAGMCTKKTGGSLLGFNIYLQNIE